MIGPGPGPGFPRPATRHRVAVAAIALAAATLYAAAALQRFLTFRNGSFDLVIFDQAVREYSRLHPPVSIVKDVHTGFAPDVTVLGDHISPVLALLAPLYWLHDGPVTLLLAQAVLVAAAIVPLWTFGRRELGTVAGYAVALGYALCWPVAQAVTFDFHEVAFAPLFTAVLFERLSAYRRGTAPWWHLALAALALAGVKEDMGLLLAGLGAALLAIGLGQRWWRRAAPEWAAGRSLTLLGAGLVGGGLLVTWLGSRLLIPAFGGGTEFDWRYSSFGASPGQALLALLSHPGTALSTVVHPGIKVQTMLLLLAIPAGTALASPYLLAVVPLLAARMLGDAPNWWGTDYHYNAFLVVPLLCAGVDGTARLTRLWARRGPARPPDRPVRSVALAWSAVVLVVALAALPSFAFAEVASASAWRGDARTRAAARALAAVPDGVLVEAANSLGPRLSGRDRVLLWDRLPRYAPWVLADVGTGQFPFCGLAEQRARVDFLATQGYQVVYDRDGFVVLHHPGTPPVAPVARAGGCG